MEITLQKMLPFSEVKGWRIGEHQLSFSNSADIFMAEWNGENASLLNELKKYDSGNQAYYYDMFLEVFRLTDEGEEEVFQKEDGWTYATEKSYVAQLEHTIILTKNGPIIVTL